MWLPVYLSQQLALLSQHANNIYYIYYVEECVASPGPTRHQPCKKCRKVCVWVCCLPPHSPVRSVLPPPTQSCKKCVASPHSVYTLCIVLLHLPPNITDRIT